jgi:hypothetical protein
MGRLDDLGAARQVREHLQRDHTASPPTNFVKRLTGKEPDSRNSSAMAEAANVAVENLKRHFVVVGVVERYGAFVDLLQALLDPQNGLGLPFWASQKLKRENSSVKSTSAIIQLIESIDRDGEAGHGYRRTSFLASFNASLRHDWGIYDAGHALFEKQAERHGVQVAQLPPPGHLKNR